MGLDWAGVWFALWTTAAFTGWLAVLVCTAFLLPTWTGRRFRAAVDAWPSRRAGLNVVGFYFGVCVLAWWWALLLSVVVVHGLDVSAVFLLAISALLTSPAYFQSKKPTPLRW